MVTGEEVALTLWLIPVHGRGWSIRSRNANGVLLLHQLAGHSTRAQESGSVACAPVCSQYSGTFWLVTLGDDAEEGNLDA